MKRYYLYLGIPVIVEGQEGWGYDRLAKKFTSNHGLANAAIWSNDGTQVDYEHFKIALEKYILS